MVQYYNLCNNVFSSNFQKMLLSLLFYAWKFSGKNSSHYTFITLSARGVYFEPPCITITYFVSYFINKSHITQMMWILVLINRVPTVRESRGILRESGKVREKRGSGKNLGILKYRSLDQLFMHFHNFCRLLGALPPDPHQGSAPVNTAG